MRKIPLIIICDVLDKINSINIEECNGDFQQLVVAKIFDTGKNIEDLTVRELNELINNANNEFHTT